MPLRPLLAGTQVHRPRVLVIQGLQGQLLGGTSSRPTKAITQVFKHTSLGCLHIRRGVCRRDGLEPVTCMQDCCHAPFFIQALKHTGFRCLLFGS